MTYLRLLRLKYLRARSQEQFRGRDFITWEEFQLLWTPELLARSGRSVDSVVMSRQDQRLEMTCDNTILTTRLEALRAQKRYQVNEQDYQFPSQHIIRTIHDSQTGSTTTTTTK